MRRRAQLHRFFARACNCHIRLGLLSRYANTTPPAAPSEQASSVRAGKLAVRAGDLRVTELDERRIGVVGAVAVGGARARSVHDERRALAAEARRPVARDGEPLERDNIVLDAGARETAADRAEQPLVSPGSAGDADGVAPTSQLLSRRGCGVGGASGGHARRELERRGCESLVRACIVAERERS